MTFSIFNFGCKVNWYESQVMSDLMVKSGYDQADDKELADIIIINSCTVTSVSDNKVLKLIRHLKKTSPDSVIVLTGCMPQAYPNMTEEFKNVDIVLGNTFRTELVHEIEKFLKDRKQIINIHKYTKNADFETVAVSRFDERTRAFVKIEDGCNRFCSYCIIPFARGLVRSKPMEVIKSELKTLAKNGYKEIVLVGINLSAYGQETGEHLCDAVEAACNIEGIERVRLGSLEPERLDKESISRLSKLDKFCPQFHLSLQSGCTSTLKRMNRHYTAEEYEQIVNNLRAVFPHCAVTTDIMVGFAGETDEEFKQSLDFVKRIGFAKVHVFPYSQREGTAAAKRTDQIDNSVKAKRSKAMIEAMNDSRAEFLNKQCGQISSVLFEQKDDEGFWHGYTINYTPVKVLSSQNLNGCIKAVKLIDSTENYCIGEIV